MHSNIQNQSLTVLGTYDSDFGDNPTSRSQPLTTSNFNSSDLIDLPEIFNFIAQQSHGVGHTAREMNSTDQSDTISSNNVLQSVRNMTSPCLSSSRFNSDVDTSYSLRLQFTVYPLELKTQQTTLHLTRSNPKRCTSLGSFQPW